jgi:hypothetical protein
MSETAVRRLAILVLVLTVVGYPLIAPLSLVLGVPNRFISIPLRAVIAGAAVLLLVGRLIDRRTIPGGAFWLAWWVFWGMYIARILVDGLLNPSVLRLPLAEYVSWSIGGCLLPSVAVATRIDELGLRRAQPMLLLLGALAIVGNVWYLFTDLALGSVLNIAVTRRQTDTLDPISLANLGTTVFLLSMWALLQPRQWRSARWVIPFFTACLGVLALLAGASRGPLLTVGTGAAFLLVMNTRQRGTSGGRWGPFAFVATGIAGLIAWAIPRAESLFVLQRLQNGFFQDDARSVLLRDGFDAFLANPLLGAGTEPLLSYPHNVLLESFMVFGILSGLLFCFIFASSVRATFRMPPTHVGTLWVAVLFLQYALGSMVSGSLYSSSGLWMMMALVVTWSEEMLPDYPSATST